MEGKRVVVLSVLVAALLLALAPGLNAAAEFERVWTYTGYYDDEIDVEVEATVQAYPGDTIDVTVTAEAREDLDDVDMDIWVEGTKDEGDVPWRSDRESVIYEDLYDGEDVEEDFEFDIPKTVDPGLILGHISCEWEVEVEVATGVYEWVLHSFDIAFPMTYLLNKDYEDLKEDYADLLDLKEELEADISEWESKYETLEDDYDSLKATYDSLRSSYDSLKSEHTTLVSDYDALKRKHSSLESEHESLLADYEDLESEHETTLDELDNYRTYTYGLGVATVVFIITTIIFAMRRLGAA